MILDFDVVFDEPNRVHFSGGDVTGNVILKLDTPLSLRCIMVKFTGESKYKIPVELINPGLHLHKHTKRKSRRKIQRNNRVGPAPVIDFKDTKKEGQENIEKQIRVNSEKYFDKGLYLFGHKYSSYREHLDEGVHKFPFKYTLPARLPTTINGRFCYVRYYCEAHLERWGAPIEKKRSYFSVSSIADINEEPKADMDCDVTRSTNCWLLCCPRGTIVVTARMNKLGVVPGQLVPSEIDIHNMSNIYIEETFLSIIQVISYYNNHGAILYEDERIVIANKRGPVHQGDSIIWVDGIKVPPLPPTSFGRVSCKLISISYKFQLQVELRRNGPIIIKLPLVIGNIPFKKDFYLFTKNANLDVDNQTTMPNTFKTMPDFPTVWSSAVGSSLLNEDDNSFRKFNPRYPFYKLYHQQEHNKGLTICANDLSLSNDVTINTDVV